MLFSRRGHRDFSVRDTFYVTRGFYRFRARRFHRGAHPRRKSAYYFRLTRYYRGVIDRGVRGAYSVAGGVSGVVGYLCRL